MAASAHGQIKSALERLKNVLDPDCLAFLNGNNANAGQTLQDLLKFDAFGETIIDPKQNSNGTFTMINAVSGGYVVGQAITVNSVGAFFYSGYNDLSLTTDRGRIQGGTEKAQGFILLHELGHLTGALTPDFNNQHQVNKNDKNLEKKCKKTINPLG